MKKEKQREDWKEGSRRRAWELKAQGWKQKDIAAALGVREGAVSQGIKSGREGGVEALRRQPAPGSQPKLSAIQHNGKASYLLREAPCCACRDSRQVRQGSINATCFSWGWFLFNLL